MRLFADTKSNTAEAALALNQGKVLDSSANQRWVKTIKRHWRPKQKAWGFFQTELDRKLEYLLALYMSKRHWRFLSPAVFSSRTQNVHEVLKLIIEGDWVSNTDTSRLIREREREREGEAGEEIERERGGEREREREEERADCQTGLSCFLDAENTCNLCQIYRRGCGLGSIRTHL